MKRIALLLALLPFVALAAPVPKGAKNSVADWGEVTDPLKDCKFEVGDSKLTITVPGKGRNLHYGAGNMDSPRVLRPVEADFTVEMTVEADWPAGALRGDDGLACFGAGLLVYEDDKNYLKLEKLYYESGTTTCIASCVFWRDGKMGYNHSDANSTPLDPKKPAKLRVKREGDDFTLDFSEDAGRTWATEKFAKLKFDAKLKIGLFATNTSKTEFKPTFATLAVVKHETVPKP